MSRGVIIVAHGSPEADWEKALRPVLAQAGLNLVPGQVCDSHAGPVGLTFLTKDLCSVTKMALALRLTGCTQILVLPLFVSGVSGHVTDLAALCRQSSDLTLGPALNNHPYVLEILFDRYRAALRPEMPIKAGVVLVGHGVRTQEEQGRWLEWAGQMAEGLFLNINTRPELQRVSVASLFPDNLRSRVEQFVNLGWVPVVLPLFLSRGRYTEEVVPHKLQGLPHRIGAPYLPHPLIGQWVKDQVDRFLTDLRR